MQSLKEWSWVRIVREKRQLVITVKNSYAGQLHLEDSRLMTSKLDEENHGYGLAAIQDIAGRYDGTFVVKAEGDYVKCDCLDTGYVKTEMNELFLRSIV